MIFLRTFAGNFDRHTRKIRYPAFSKFYWISACVGTTESESPDYISRRRPLSRRARGAEQIGRFGAGSGFGRTPIRQIVWTVLQCAASLSPRDPARAPSFPADSSRNRRKWVSRPPFLLQTHRGLSPPGNPDFPLINRHQSAWTGYALGARAGGFRNIACLSLPSG
jgi:hypothetical protein